MSSTEYFIIGHGFDEGGGRQDTRHGPYGTLDEAMRLAKAWERRSNYGTYEIEERAFSVKIHPVPCTR